MVEYFEIAPSSTSHCATCKKLIEKGEARGVFSKNYRNYTSNGYMCLKCSKKEIKSLLKEASKYIQFD